MKNKKESLQETVRRVIKEESNKTYMYSTIGFTTKQQALERENLLKSKYGESLLSSKIKKDFNNRYRVEYILSDSFENLK